MYTHLSRPDDLCIHVQVCHWINSCIHMQCMYLFNQPRQDTTEGQSNIGKMVRVFTNGLGDLGLTSGQVISKTQKMVLDATLLSTQHYKVRIKVKVEQSRERSSALPLHLGVVAIKKGAFGSPSTTVTYFTYSWSEFRVFFS